MEIEFINTSGVPLEPPYPAKNSLPVWYQDTPSYLTPDGKPRPSEDLSDVTKATIKKCMPVFDAISSGYIICTPVDVFVEQKDGAPYFIWPSLDFIVFHPKRQAPLHPKTSMSDNAIPKFTNPWGIKTSKGTSCLFIEPMHRETPVSILPGIVDTDTYNLPVEFPFVLKSKDFEGLIPAGTEIVQVIPFRRDSWESSTTEKTIQEVTKEQGKSINLMFFNGYKKLFWTKKLYS